MTVIIALRHSGINYIAADRRTSAWYDLVNDSTDKIFKHNWCLIGMAGGVKEEWLFRKALAEAKTLKIDSEAVILDIYLRVRTFMKDYALWDLWEDPEVEALFVTNKHIRKLRSDGSIVEHKDYACVWCGTDYAKGILSNTKITKPEQDLKTVIKLVSKHTIGVSPNSTVKVAMWPTLIKKILKIKKELKKKKK
jgi:ATP-dependent protease HslVU (ClpYQ) peptidase subunit